MLGPTELIYALHAVESEAKAYAGIVLTPGPRQAVSGWVRKSNTENGHTISSASMTSFVLGCPLTDSFSRLLLGVPGNDCDRHFGDSKNARS